MAETEKITKPRIVMATTVITALVVMSTIISYNPSALHYRDNPTINNKTTNPKITGYEGEPQMVGAAEESTRKNFDKNKKTLEIPLPNNNYYDKLPSSFPVSPPSVRPQLPKNEVKPSATYARHVAITEAMGNGLSSKFKLENMSANKNNSNRYNTSYVITDNGETTERYDLMSITKTENLRMIKTAKDALKSLIEESDAVNIIDYDDNMLLYDIAGEKGYQVGKIMVDDDGIYIVGYINFTTNTMPSIIREDWLNKLKSLN